MTTHRFTALAAVELLKPIEGPIEMDLLLSEAAARVGLSAEEISRSVTNQTHVSLPYPTSSFARSNSPRICAMQ